MTLVELMHPQGRHGASVASLITKCNLLNSNMIMMICPDRVSFADSQGFGSALEGKPINIKGRYFLALSQQSEPF
jgi:hypothetical protein